MPDFDRMTAFFERYLPLIWSHRTTSDKGSARTVFRQKSDTDLPLDAERRSGGKRNKYRRPSAASYAGFALYLRGAPCPMNTRALAKSEKSSCNNLTVLP